MQQVLLNFVFMHTAVKKIQFFYSWALNFLFMRNFVQKKIIYFEWMRNFVQNWFRIDKKMMRNFVQKSHFVQNHETVAQENWLFRGNPSRNGKVAG